TGVQTCALPIFGVGGLGCHLDVVRGGHVVAVAPGVGGEVAGLEGGAGLGRGDDAGRDVKEVQACLHGCEGGGVDAGDADLGVSGGEVLGDRGVGAQRVGHGDCLGVLVVVQGVLAVGEGLVAGGAGLGGLPVVEVDVDDVTAAFEEQGVHGGADGEVLLIGWVVLLVPVPGGVLHDGADAADPQALHRLVLGLGRAVEDRHARVPSCVVVPPTTMWWAAGWSELARVVLRVGQAAHAAVDADGDELPAEGQPLAARDRDAVAALPDGL